MSYPRIEIAKCLPLWVLILLPTTFALGGEPLEGPPFPRIANVYGTALTQDGGTFHGETRTTEEVARYDLLLGVRRPHGGDEDGQLFRNRLRELKTLNPHLLALHFACSAPYTHIAPIEQVLANREPGQMLPWLLQTDGTPITGWPSTYMLNMAAPNVVEWLAHQTVPAVQTVGYDGIFIDCMGDHFDSWACEIATGKPYTVDFNADGEDDDRDMLAEIWTNAKTALAHRTRELLGDEAVFMANQAGPSTYDQLNGIYLEDYVDGVLDRNASWEDLLEKYLYWTKTPRRPNVTVLGCSSGVEPPFQAYKLSPEEKAEFLERGKPLLERMRFGLATTLMGDGYYSYDLHTRWRGQYWWYPEFDAPLGYPTEPCQRRADGVWTRQFDGGLVVVNPTNWDTMIEFPRQHRDVSSGRVDDEFVLPRLDGRIYIPDPGPHRPGTLPSLEPALTALGSAGLVQRDDTRILRDGSGMALMIDPSGRIKSLRSHGNELIDSIETIIVTDGKWQNFETKDLRHEVASDGTVTLTAKRIHGDQVLDYTQTARLVDHCLRLEYRWRAATDLQVRAFRQSVRFSPRMFAGTVLRADEQEILLPTEVSDAPELARGVTSATLPVGQDMSMTIQMPRPANLVDDRYYNGPGYFLAFYPLSGKIPEGREWSYTIEISLTRTPGK